MVEQLDDFDFDYRDLALPIRKKPLKFRDEDFEPAAKKLKPRQLQTGFGTLARKTLFDLPDAEWLTLISEAGFSAKALSPRSIEQLEVIFRHSATENRLDKSA
ncbi:hypothetical protein HYS90_02515, partial [Candidatus Curtissbacteria bacterium]|nr:hypothetical protein [Candidatus Curtissbacteria bacterium]